MTATLKMSEIAERIHAHLERFEKDPEINIKRSTKTGAIDPMGAGTYYQVNAYYRSGARIGVKYIGYQTTSQLTRSEALAYLAWLDEGNIGSHYLQQAEAKKTTRSS